MKKILLLAMLLLAVLNCEAQSVPVKVFELEPFVGVTYGLASNADTRHSGPALGLEARWNIWPGSLDIGDRLYIGAAVIEDRGGISRYYTFSETAFIDHNFNRGRAVSPFVGVGLSLNYYGIIGDREDGYDRDAIMGPGFVPRVGVEFFRHLRLTLMAQLGKKNYDTVALTIGYAFGGGKRKDS